MAAPPRVPMVLPPVAAEPIAPPATAPPTVPMVSPLPVGLPPQADRAAAAARPSARKVSFRYQCLRLCKKKDSKRTPVLWLVATPQEKNDEQHGDGNAEGPQKDVAELPFLLATPLLNAVHKSLHRVADFRIWKNRMQR